MLAPLDLRVEPGETLLLKGPSGSGKTTLLHICGLLAAPTEGEVLFDGRSVSSMTDAARSELRLRAVGHVFQSHNMIPDLTLAENVALPLRLARRADPARIASLLEAVGLSHRADHLPAAVSVGERQRAAVARALVLEPRLVLADEPTASLDAVKATQILTLLLDLQREHGYAFVVASHDPRAWEAVRGSRIVELDHGRVVFTGKGASGPAQRV